MQKNESYVTPILPLLLFILLSLSNGIAQVAAGDVVSNYEQGVLKIIEYGIGISVAAAMLTGAIASIRESTMGYILIAMGVILLINLLMPLFVKFIFMAIITCVLVAMAICFIGPLTLFFAYIFGTLGTIIGILFVVATIVANSVVGGW